MNWYLAQKQLGLFGQDPDNDEPFQGQVRPLFNPNSIPNEDTRFSGNLLEDIEYWQSDWSHLFHHYKVELEPIDLGGEQYWLFNYGKKRYLFEQDGSYEEAIEWLGGVYDPFKFIDAKDFNKEFWDDVGEGYVLYHATNPDNIESIKQQGLTPQDETRGIGNRGTGAAVFTSSNSDTIDVYGAALIAINVGQMKQDGYMPFVSLEEPIEEKEAYEALAHKLGIEEYYHEIESGIDEDTVIFYDTIPVKYLSFVK